MKTALVTGSTSGIGLGIARTLADAGYRLVLHGLGEPELVTQLQTELSARSGHQCLIWQADLSQGTLPTALLPEVDVLINNAGIQHTAPVTEFPAERWNAVLAINLSAAFHLIAATLPGMNRRGWGRIINIASAHGLVASAEKSAYVAAKHGLIGLTKVVALEQARGGVTCNAICPGWVLTPLVQAQIEARAQRQAISVPEAELQLLAEKQPSGRFTTPEQLGALALFLCSPGGDNLTGTALPVDGGWTAQ